MQPQYAIISGLINVYKQHNKWQRRGDKVRRGSNIEENKEQMYQSK